MISPNVAVRTLPALDRYAGWGSWDPTTGPVNVNLDDNNEEVDQAQSLLYREFFFYSDVRHSRVCGLSIP